MVIQIAFSPESKQRLDALIAKTEADSPAEVIANALRLYEALIERYDANQPLYERTDAGYVEYQMFQPTA